MNFKELYQTNRFGPSHLDFGFDPRGPYRFEELEQAAELIDACEANRWLCIHRCVRAVARYQDALPFFVQEQKTDARDWIADMQNLSRQIISKLQDMPVSAGVALYKNAARCGDKESRPHADILNVLQDYLAWQEGALELAEEQARRGRARENDLLRQLDGDMRSAFIEATGAVKGFYTFLRVMLEPLLREGFSKSLLEGDGEAFRQGWRQAIRVRP